MLPVKGAKKNNVESDENLFSNFKPAHCGSIWEGEFVVSNQKHTKIKFGFVWFFFFSSNIFFSI